MKCPSLILILTASSLLAVTPVQETDREFSAAGDFNGDGFSDLLVLDKTSGVYRIGYGSASGALTFAEGRAARPAARPSISSTRNFRCSHFRPRSVPRSSK